MLAAGAIIPAKLCSLNRGHGKPCPTQGISGWYQQGRSSGQYLNTGYRESSQPICISITSEQIIIILFYSLSLTHTLSFGSLWFSRGSTPLCTPVWLSHQKFVPRNPQCHEGGAVSFFFAIFRLRGRPTLLVASQVTSPWLPHISLIIFGSRSQLIQRIKQDGWWKDGGGECANGFAIKKICCWIIHPAKIPLKERRSSVV